MHATPPAWTCCMLSVLCRQAMSRSSCHAHVMLRCMFHVTCADDILDFSRLDSGDTALQHAPFALHELLVDVHALLQHTGMKHAR